MSGPELSLVLIGGPSGVGKSRLAQAVALETASAVAQIDDLQVAIETLVPPDRLPDYHHLATTYLRIDDPTRSAGQRRRSRHGSTPRCVSCWARRTKAPREEGSSQVPGQLLRRDGDEQAGRATVSATRSRRLAERCHELGGADNQRTAVRHGALPGAARPRSQHSSMTLRGTLAS